MGRPKGSKNKSVAYFRKEHQDALVEYVQTDDIARRDVLYRQFLGPVFEELINKIVYTYKFNNLPNIEDLKQDCKSYTLTMLEKFDPGRNKKAFSYFTVVVKNWFLGEQGKWATRNRREIEYSSITNALEEDLLCVPHSYETQMENFEFWDNFISEMETWRASCRKDSPEEKVLDAIFVLFENADKLEIFAEHKNKEKSETKYRFVLRCLENITGLQTQIISRILNDFKNDYCEFRNEWDSGNI